VVLRTTGSFRARGVTGSRLIGYLQEQHQSSERVYGELLFRQQQADEIVRGNEIATGNCWDQHGCAWRILNHTSISSGNNLRET